MLTVWSKTPRWWDLAQVGATKWARKALLQNSWVGETWRMKCERWRTKANSPVYKRILFWRDYEMLWNWLLAMSNWKIPEAPCRFSAKRTSFLGFRPIGGSLTKICATNTATTTKVQKAGERKPDICDLGQNEGIYILDILICFQ